MRLRIQKENQMLDRTCSSDDAMTREKMSQVVDEGVV